MCNHDHNKNKPSEQRGVGLEHGQLHAHDHAQWSRRTFLQRVGLAGTATFLLGRTPLAAIGASPLANALNTVTEDRILVLIRLKGGNDGLNTIIPIFDYGRYQSNRPGIAIAQSQTIALSNELAMPNTMNSLNALWQDGRMKVVNNVGYPDHNLSHFGSTDIWSAAVDAGQATDSGWLGRYLEDLYPDFVTDPPTTPPAIQMSNAGNITFENSDGFDMSLNATDPAQLYEIAQTGQLYDALDVPPCHYGEQLGYLRSVANNTFRYASVVNQAFEQGTNSREYENNSLAQQLALVARLIRGGLGTRLYMVGHDGFDTHAGQLNQHATLLSQLANAVTTFHEDLADGGHGHRVLSMTFSEFGRRPEQNASMGTDHGSAAPLFLFGEGLNGNGFLGGLPDLQNLDNAGNLRFQVDFRQVYATVLEQWLCIDASLVDDVLGETFDRLGGLGLTCNTVGTFQPDPAALGALQAYYHGGQLYVNYQLYQTDRVKITLYNMLGQPLHQAFDGFQMSGPQHLSFPLSNIGWAAGVYVCTVQIGNRRYAQQIQLVR